MLTVSDVNFFFPEIKFSDFTVVFFPSLLHCRRAEGLVRLPEEKKKKDRKKTILNLVLFRSGRTITDED